MKQKFTEMLKDIANMFSDVADVKIEDFYFKEENSDELFNIADDEKIDEIISNMKKNKVYSLYGIENDTTVFWDIEVRYKDGNFEYTFGNF